MKYPVKMYIDKFNRTYPQNQQTQLTPRVAIPDDVVICKNDGFFCNNRKLDIAVNDKKYPFICANNKYISGLQYYDGRPFKPKTWVFLHKGKVLAYKNNHLIGLKDGYLQITEKEMPNAWDPHVD